MISGTLHRAGCPVTGTQLPTGQPIPLTGAAAPGTKIQIFDDGKLVAETIADKDGQWSLLLPAMAAGEHRLTARTVGPDGKAQASAAPLSVVVVAAPSPSAPAPGTRSAPRLPTLRYRRPRRSPRRSLAQRRRLSAPRPRLPVVWPRSHERLR